MRHAGFLLFSIGVILCILAGAKVPAEGQEWPDTMLVFGVGMVIAIAGIVWWRAQAKAASSSAAAGAGANEDPATLLRELQGPLSQLGEDIGELDAKTITERVDDLLIRFVLPFAEVRDRLIERLGMEAGAEILVIVAFGERLLNRTWSAAADGHVGEARASFPEALEAFQEAATMLPGDAA